MKKLTLLAFIVLTFCVPSITQAADGTPIWTNILSLFNGVANSSDSPRAITVDTNGNSYVTGYVINAQSNSDFETVKYSPAGTTIWTRALNGVEKGNDIANAVVVDGNGNVYVTGRSLGTGTGDDFLTLKYSATGTLQRQFRYNSAGSNDDSAVALAVDASGEICVTGQSFVSATNSVWTTVKYSSVGMLSWSNTFNGSGIGFDQAKAIAVDPSGGVYVSGYATGPTGDFDYALIKYSSVGTLLWVNKFNGASNSDDLVQSLALDNEGNTYVTGISTGAGDSFDYATIKISSTGLGVWTNFYNGPDDSDDEAVAVALDPSENVYVTGTSIGAEGSYGYVTVKYSNAGVPAWTNFFNGVGNRGGQASALAVDGTGNAYVTGTSFGGLRPDEFVTIKYSTDGTAAWTNFYNGGSAAAVATDASGNAYVTGGGGGDFTTIKYSAVGTTPLSFVTANFGTFNTQFVLSLKGPTGSNVIISASTNFQNWVPFATNQIPSSILQVTDTLAPNYPSRFYRAHLQ